MKVNKLVSNITFFILGVFSLTSLQAQEPKHCS